MPCLVKRGSFETGVVTYSASALHKLLDRKSPVALVCALHLVLSPASPACCFSRLVKAAQAATRLLYRASRARKGLKARLALCFQPSSAQVSGNLTIDSLKPPAACKESQPATSSLRTTVSTLQRQSAEWAQSSADHGSTPS